MATDQTQLIESLAKATAGSVASLSLPDLSEPKAHLEDRCDFLLTKLDAFNQLLKAVSEQADFLQMNLPKLMVARENMKQVYAQVDQLEALIADVTNSLASLESKVDIAETLFTTSYQQKIFRVFQNALGSSNPAAASGDQYRRQVKYVPPELFRAQDYFPSPGSAGAEPTSTATNSEEQRGDAENHDLDRR